MLTLEAQIVIDTYTDEDMRDMMFNGSADCICTECGVVVVSPGEPDLYGVEYDCPNCDADGGKIKSVLVIVGLI